MEGTVSALEEYCKESVERMHALIIGNQAVEMVGKTLADAAIAELEAEIAALKAAFSGVEKLLLDVPSERDYWRNEALKAKAEATEGCYACRDHIALGRLLERTEAAEAALAAERERARDREAQIGEVLDAEKKAHARTLEDLAVERAKRCETCGLKNDCRVRDAVWAHWADELPGFGCSEWEAKP